MATCRCPECEALFEAESSGFGQEHTCTHCGAAFSLDTAHLAHFTLPNAVRIRLVDRSGSPARIPDVAVVVSYGYTLPPLLTDNNGCLSVTSEMFDKAQAEAISTGLMDRGDYSLARFITIDVLSADELAAMGHARSQSGWQVLPFEQELYGDLDGLCRVYVQNANGSVMPAKVQVDLAQAQDPVDVQLCVVENEEGV